MRSESLWETKTSWPCDLRLLQSVSFRYHCPHRLHSGRVCQNSGQHLRHFGAAQPALPADPPHGAHGPARRHLEAAGLRGLRAQQGEPAPLRPRLRAPASPKADVGFAETGYSHAEDTVWIMQKSP